MHPLKERARARHWTYADLAKRIEAHGRHVSPGYLRLVLNGNRRPSYDLARIFVAMLADLDESEEQRAPAFTVHDMMTFAERSRAA